METYGNIRIQVCGCDKTAKSAVPEPRRECNLPSHAFWHLVFGGADQMYSNAKPPPLRLQMNIGDQSAKK